MKDLAKRRRIMKRSIRLGHCICDPKKGCPCDLFREKDICTCAGERPEPESGPVRLTQMVEKAGCASKIDKSSLRLALADLPEIDDPRVLVGTPAGDDAGVYRLDGKTALVQTVDVFSPSVDDPFTFGQVAAANSLSDVYAMGGRPLTALSIVGFPSETMHVDVMREILRGGLDKMAEAGVPVIGGHSIKDDQIKAGFAVTGVVSPDRVMTNAAIEPDDVLILTKPLGTGLISFAGQIDRAPAPAVEAIARSMTMLNGVASELMLEHDAHACTDVTGFGLAGHLSEMASRSGVDVEVIWDDLPLFDGVLEVLAAEIIPGGVERNREASGDVIIRGPSVELAMVDVLLDPQTSGGLLIAVGEDHAEALLDALHATGHVHAAVIGRALGKGTGVIRLETRGERVIPQAPKDRTQKAPQAPKPAATAVPTEACCPEETMEEEACCADGPETSGGVAGESTGGEAIRRSFKAFMQAASRPGGLDAFTRQAMAIALSVLTKCEPCLRLHIVKARKMGFSDEEIEEAAWMAISFGGSPVMMFYDAVSREL